jgi:hypothetical protein
MKSRIARLYNVLVIGGAVAASSACTKDTGKTPDPKDPPAAATPAKAPDPTPKPADPAPVPPATKDTDATPTEKAAPAVADPTAATTPDDKTKTVKKKTAGKAPGSGAKGWS